MADVSANLKDWSATAASNNPAGGTTIGTGLDDNLREIQKVVRQDLATKGADIAASATTDVGAVAGLYHDITGASTITSLGTTASAGIWKILQFDSTPVITHNTAIQLPGAANITAAAGDVATFMCEASNVFRCTSFIRSASPPLDFATQAQQETGTSNVVAVTPGRQQFHPSAAKGWAYYDNGTALTANYNADANTDTQAGDHTIGWATDFSSGSYCAVAIAVDQSTEAAATTFVYNIHTLAVGTTRVQSRRASDGVRTDPSVGSMVVVLGDQ